MWVSQFVTFGDLERDWGDVKYSIVTITHPGDHKVSKLVFNKHGHNSNINNPKPPNHSQKSFLYCCDTYIDTLNLKIQRIIL